MIKRSVISTIFKKELLLIRSEKAPWIVMLVMFLTLTYALLSGLQFGQNQTNSAAALKRAADEKFIKQKAGAEAIARGEKPIPDRPYRDPGNTIYVGSSMAEMITLPPSPLAFLAVGVRDLYPAAIPVSGKGKEGFLFEDEISNPTHLLSGIVDPAFVLVFLLPLFIIALCYSIISSEREQGTLSLNASSSVPLRVIMSVKLLVRAGIPVVTAIATLLCAVLIHSSHSLGNVLVLSAALVIYTIFWAGASLLINGLGLDSTANALVMSVIWIVQAIVTPAGIDAVVELNYPTLSRASMVLAIRNANVQADVKLDAAQAQFELDHAGTGHVACDSVELSHIHRRLVAGSIDDKNYRRFQSIKLAQQVGDSIYHLQQKRVDDRSRLADLLCYLSPVLIMQNIITDIAGTGPVRMKLFQHQIDRFHDQWRTFFISRAEQGIRLDGKIYDQFPKFVYKECSAKQVRDRLILGITVMIIFAGGISLSAKWLLNRSYVLK